MPANVDPDTGPVTVARLFRARLGYRPDGPVVPIIDADGFPAVGLPRLDPHNYGWHDLPAADRITADDGRRPRRDMERRRSTFAAVPAVMRPEPDDLIVVGELWRVECLARVESDGLAGVAWRRMLADVGMADVDSRVELWRAVVTTAGQLWT